MKKKNQIERTRNKTFNHFKCNKNCSAIHDDTINAIRIYIGSMYFSLLPGIFIMNSHTI